MENEKCWNNVLDFLLVELLNILSYIFCLQIVTIYYTVSFMYKNVYQFLRCHRLYYIILKNTNQGNNYCPVSVHV